MNLEGVGGTQEALEEEWSDQSHVGAKVMCEGSQKDKATAAAATAAGADFLFS